MLFKPYLVTEILAGRKTATRRDWKRPHAKVGGTYPVQARMYQPRSECPIIECTAFYRQALKDMTEADARAEGVKDLAEFKRIWIEINGEWTPEKVVYVIEFRLLSVPEEVADNAQPIPT